MNNGHTSVQKEPVQLVDQTTEAIAAFIRETLSREETKTSPEMVAAIAELVHAIFPY